MTDWSHLKDEEESEYIQEIRATAQAQFVSASERIVKLEDELSKYRDKYGEL